MLDFRELTERLLLGELKNIGLHDDTDYRLLAERHRLGVAMHVNRGLKHLYSRFILSEKELMLRTHPGITHYYMRKAFARSNPDQNGVYRYIDDTACGEFEDDWIKVLKVHDEQGRELPIDDDEDYSSIFTPTWDCLQITHIHQGRHFSVIYQASHPRVSAEEPCSSIYLPPFLEDALQSYVAGKVISHMNGPEHTAKGAEYMGQYEAICAEAQMKDLVQTSVSTTNTKLKKRGFV